VVGQQKLFEYVDLQHAKTATEGNLLFGGDALVAKDHHMVIQVRAMNTREILVIDWPGQVQTDNLRTDAAGQRANLEILGGKDRCWNSRGGRHEFTPGQTGE